MTIQAAEFFAGMGLVRAGLELCGIQTIFANDVDEKKASLYRGNWGCRELRVADIRDLGGDDVPTVDVATASFPCVDTSIAGDRAGLVGDQSGLVFEFVRVISEMGERAPGVVLLENVPGFLTTDGGHDFIRVISDLDELGYRCQHLSVDAAAFVPQSRPRVFVLGKKDGSCRVPEPPPLRSDLRLFDVASRRGEWWTGERKKQFLNSLSPIQAARLDRHRTSRRVSYLGAYRRTRKGRAVWEIRPDEIAGALRTTGGGSSRQAIVRAGRGTVDMRWMDLREYARLQGAEKFRFGAVSERQAMFALGDAVCVPVVKWIGENWLCPALAQ
jgi:DNA (cytosine-5)-methyltransferase 1